MSIKIEERIYIQNIKDDMNNKKVTIAGWIHEKRKLGGIQFILLRDRTGVIQITVHKKSVTPEIFTLFSQISKESVIYLRGVVIKNPQAISGHEIIPEEVEIISKSNTPLPLDVTEKVKADLDTRLDNRFMDLRKPRNLNLFISRSSLIAGIREYCLKQGFIEVITPKIVAAGAEGGSTLFPIAYYEKEAYLAQSPQLYKQMLMSTGFDRVIEIAPAYRAEKSDTVRHLSEFTSIDMEMAFIKDEDDVMTHLENTISYAIKYLLENNKEVVKNMLPDLNPPKLPFPRIEYSEAVELLQDKNKEIQWGEDLDTEAEKLLGEIMAEDGHDFYFITKYPSRIKPFYIMVEDTKPEICRAFDLGYKGMEITSGGQREHRIEPLEIRIKEAGLDIDDFKFYLDAFRYGMPPHGGLGLGIERLLQKLFKISNVRETVLFPRDRKRLVP